MQQTLTTFKQFYDLEQAKEILTLLQAHGIVCEIATVSSGLDNSFNGQFSKEYVVKVLHQDFKKAEQIVEQEAAGWIANAPEDYYLFTFTEDELREVIEKKYEWSEYDYLLAKKLLTDKGITIDEVRIEGINRNQISEQAKPQELDSSWITKGYIRSFLGGSNIVMSYVILTSKKTLRDGRVVYAYKDSDRMHARMMLAISVAVISILFTYIIVLKF